MLPLRSRVDLGAMTITGFSAFPKAPALQFSVLSWRLVGEVLPHCRDAVRVFSNPSHLGQPFQVKVNQRVIIMKELQSDTAWCHIRTLFWGLNSLQRYSWEILRPLPTGVLIIGTGKFATRCYTLQYLKYHIISCIFSPLKMLKVMPGINLNLKKLFFYVFSIQ